MESEHNTKLTSSEIGSLWSTYINNTMSVCVLQYFIKNVNDPDIKSVLEYALDSSEKIVSKITEILKEENLFLPVGFTDKDVNLAAPRLYSDYFYLYYLKQMSKIGSSIYGVALATLARSDIRDLFTEWIASSVTLYNKTADVLLTKGIFIRTPIVFIKNKADIVKKQNYLGSIFSGPRPLNVIEITHLCANLEANRIGQTLLTGFAQVAKSKQVAEFMMKGKEISKKQVQIFSKTLIEEDVPAPIEWDMDISASTTPPFSDKLMMFHIGVLAASGLSNLATAAAASFRKDIAADYIRLSAEIGQYNLEGAEIMIDNGWLEQPPQMLDRKHLGQD